MNNLVLVTGNKNKIKEFEEILDFKIKSIDLDLHEVQAIQVEEVVLYKTKEAYKQVGMPVLCEDTGLYFDAWNGLPGAFIKWFGKAIGYENICPLLKENRRAKAETVIGYFNGKDYKSFQGEVLGSISLTPQGKTNFGWDPIFIPNGFQKTFAEMSSKEKNNISMRKIALEKLRDFLQ